MADSVPNRPTVWQALDTWAGTLKPWQRQILAYATRRRTLDDAQIGEIYTRFLEDSGLAEPTQRRHVAVEISGRAPSEAAKPLRLICVADLVGINALPDGCSLTFGPALTVIYGRNGAGKSGFARLFANACFSRHRPSILPNIYEDVAPRSPGATIRIALDGASAALRFAVEVEHAELRRISFFDTAVAKHHMTESAPFEFKPSGFDVFPEMARVYGQLALRLDSDIKGRTHDTNFAASFIGNETPISKAAASVGPSTDLAPIRSLATYGPTEKARFDEVNAQLTALKSKSPREALAQLKQASSDIAHLSARLTALAQSFTAERAATRTALSAAAKETAETATALGSEQFKRPFFSAVGTPEWQVFAKAAHALGRKEGGAYPTEDARCLLCERPFDEKSRVHVAALLSFVESDAQRKADAAAAALREEAHFLRQLDIDVFPPASRVWEHVHRIDPGVRAAIEELAAEFRSACENAREALRTQSSCNGSVRTELAVAMLAELTGRIDADIRRLETEDPSHAITSLEAERQALRHREVLAQLLPAIERHVADAAWCQKAQRAKSSLNPRPITEKEKELFAEIIGETYRTRLAQECEELDCVLPIELQTAGQKGETVRSLWIKGGKRPDAILSEGEQKAVALADFLTEVALNPNNAGIVLDDPVTSQDHQRKERIAHRLVKEAACRQVIVFTHDLVFLNQLMACAESQGIDTQAHWVDRDQDGRPGYITLNDVPATSKAYETSEKARQYLAQAQTVSGTARHQAICGGMAALRRTIEETVVKRLFKGIVPRWEDRVIVTGLRRVAWDNTLADELVAMYEDLSAYIEGHSHTDEAMGAPPEINDLEQKVASVDALIKRAKADRSTAKNRHGGNVHQITLEA